MSHYKNKQCKEYVSLISVNKRMYPLD